jgi:hypothetical protein
MEYEADRFAFLHIVSVGQGSISPTHYVMSLIVAMSSLTISSEYLAGNNTNPPPYERVLRIMTYLNYEPNDGMWGFASWALMQWRPIYRKMAPVPRRFDSQKQYFIDVVAGLRKYDRLYSG